MKKAIIEGMCCKGCANEVKSIFENLYGVSNVEVSEDRTYVIFKGYLSKRVIQEAFENTNYKLVSIEKLEK